ncbi:MAG TPA: response regulator [Candidatus Micrarchaeia archaeon]|nr:response regulator [Candidatus Micrarchaeia archaeon]
MACQEVVLIVDDDEIYRNRLRRAFADRGWKAVAAATGKDAIELAAKAFPGLAIVDLRLPGMGGLEIVRELHSVDEEMCIIVLTGYGSIATALAATKLGASHYLGKPVDVDQILGVYRMIDGKQKDPPDESSLYSVPSLGRVEWEHIQRVLADCDGNISQTAKILGLHRRSLQRKLGKFPPRS